MQRSRKRALFHSQLVQGVTGHDYYPQRRLLEHTGHLHLSPPIFLHICVTSDHDVIKYEPRIIVTALMLGPRMKVLISELRKRMW